jgi:4-hydroxy-tetrahydrodipicolinate reductase
METDMTTHIAIAGILGRMGREVLEASQANDDAHVVAGIVRPGTLPRLNGHRPDVSLVEQVDAIMPAIDVLVDFTTADASVAHVRACAEAGRPYVTGVTGHTPVQMEELRAAAGRIPVFHARNMSVGLNALLGLLPALVRVPDGYDVEIVEMHHRHKTDAPSGTALALAEAIASARETTLADHAIHGRHGAAPRTPGEVGIHAVRGGGNAGEHVVIFADEGEEIRMRHRAYSRRTFALGALRAATFVTCQPAGFYTMAELMHAAA